MLTNSMDPVSTILLTDVMRGLLSLFCFCIQYINRSALILLSMEAISSLIGYLTSPPEVGRLLVVYGVVRKLCWCTSGSAWHYWFLGTGLSQAKCLAQLLATPEFNEKGGTLAKYPRLFKGFSKLGSYGWKGISKPTYTTPYMTQ